MLNIDFTFFKNNVLTSEQESIGIKYNELFKNKIIGDIKEIDEQTQCDICSQIDLSSTTELDLRNIIEVDCKGTLGKNYCYISETVDEVTLARNNFVIIKLSEGIEIASILEFGGIVKLKRRKLGLYGEEIPEVIRFATESDIEQYNINIGNEKSAKKYFLESVKKNKLDMKLVDVHYQFDKKKLYFYYTSDGRVDFRTLVKELASEFKTRIELRQIGVRDEAKRIGGLGSCGREYCCSSFLSNFKKITTQIASEQNLSTFLSKHSGPCGKLKCCLCFEVD